MAKLAIEAIGEISIRLPTMTKPIIKQLATFIQLQRDYITDSTIIAL